MQLKRFRSTRGLTVLFTLAIIFGVLAATLPAGASGVYKERTLPLMPQLSTDGKTLYNPGLIAVVVDDPNPSTERLSIPAPEQMIGSAHATASFQISYVPDGDAEIFEGHRCYAWPASAKAAVERAAEIWGNIIQSSVPITIRACWYQADGNTLGFSGSPTVLRNFPNAPRSNTWYSPSLANSLAGEDRDPDDYDMHIAMNRSFSWYYGTDAGPPSNQHDFVTVMMHEIAHGLNFSGSMRYSTTTLQASWGFNSGAPNIYDTFMRDGSGNQIINTSVYPNPSSALANAVTSNNLWWHGNKAMAANSGQRVKMYAPATWRGGSSYSHLDYDTFSGPNRMMRWAISSGDAIHDPGPVTKGILEDMGWKVGSAAEQKAVMTSPSNGSTFSSTTVTFQWTNVGAPEYWLQIGTSTGASNLFNQSTGNSTSASVTGLPSDGRTVYARLWTKIAGSWTGNYNDYIYTAYRGTTEQKAVMTSPSNGSTFSTTTVTFQWTNTGASEYWLQIGTSTGASNLFNQSTGNSTSATVTGLPSDGRTVYARLWTKIAGSWTGNYNDYTYTAYQSTTTGGLELLKGRWRFSYTISTYTFTDEVTLRTIIESPTTPGLFGIIGTNGYGYTCTGLYQPDISQTTPYFILCDGLTLQDMYLFNTDGATVLTGSYRFRRKSDGRYSNSYRLSGQKTSSSVASTPASDGAAYDPYQEYLIEQEKVGSAGESLTDEDPTTFEMYQNYLEQF